MRIGPIEVNKEYVNACKIPLDLFFSEKELAFDWKLRDIKKNFPNIIVDERINDVGDLLFYISSLEDLKNAAIKYVNDKNL
jgi:hypothetical protein